jgi:acetylornithine/N-succinyldiaminopimelate aminotransferase
LTVINRLDESFLSEVKEKSGYIFGELCGAEGVERVSGMGLMIGIKTTGNAKEIVNECINQGVLCLTAKDKVRLLPPLNIPMDSLKKAIEVIKSVCKEKK